MPRRGTQPIHEGPIWSRECTTRPGQRQLRTLTDSRYAYKNARVRKTSVKRTRPLQRIQRSIQKQDIPQPGSLLRKPDQVNEWLSQLSLPGGQRIHDKESLSSSGTIMPPKSVAAVSTLDNTMRTRKPATVKMDDPNYLGALRYRNCYIEAEKPPPAVMERAKTIILPGRASPELDDYSVNQLTEAVRQLRNCNEATIKQELAPYIVPAAHILADRKLISAADTSWSRCAHLDLDPGTMVGTAPLPLRDPKPDIAFGFNSAAFNQRQYRMIDLLVKDQFGESRSYAIPDQKLRFPFLGVEFKSLAKNGSPYVATNQAATAGAIAMNACLQLCSSGSNLESLQLNEPQYFSITVDEEMACVNVHWIRKPADDEPYQFHLERLSAHYLRDPAGVRSLRRAIKNILDYASNERLQWLCAALDEYRKVMLATAATPVDNNDAPQVDVDLCTPEQGHEMSEVERQGHKRGKQSGTYRERPKRSYSRQAAETNGRNRTQPNPDMSLGQTP